MMMMFNTSDNNDTYNDDVPEWLSNVFLPLMSSIVCITGILGNGFVIFILLQYSGLRTVPNVYIFNLALADLLFLCSLPFLTYSSHVRHWIFGEVLCKIVMGIDSMNMFTGIFILTAMSIDRYMAIVHGIRSMKYRTVKAAKIINCLMWLLSAIATLPVWIYATTIPLEEGSDILACDIIWPENMHSYGAWFIIYTFLIGFLLPVLIISGCYIFILSHVRTSGPRSENNRKSSSASKRVFIMVSLAVAAFVVCWLPFYTLRLLYKVFNYYSDQLKIFFIITTCLGYANSALNPLIYTYPGGNFRRNLAQIRRRSGSRKSSFRTSDRHSTIRHGCGENAEKRRIKQRRKRRYQRYRDDTAHGGYETTYTSCVVIQNNSREVIGELVSVI
ncbi:somatostatin receptor type 2-like [Glandiceps talaboti]